MKQKIKSEYGSGTNYILDENASLSGNKWAHLICTWDGTTLKLYVNASLLSSHNATSGPGNTADRNYSFSGGGYLDDLGIWNEALTAAEITQLYNSGVPLTASSNYGNYTSSKYG